MLCNLSFISNLKHLLKCHQYANNTFDLNSCLVETNLDECIKKHARPTDIQSKQIEAILTRYIETSETQLASAISQAQYTLMAPLAAPTLPPPAVLTSQSSTDLFSDIDLLSLDFSVDTVDAGAVPSQSNLELDNNLLDLNPDPDHTFDLNTELDTAQLDTALSNFDQTMSTSISSPAPIGFRTLLEESTASTLTELKPVNSSDLASQLANDVLKEQFLSAEEIVVSHSRKDSSSITIMRSSKKKPGQPVTIVDDVAKDELISYLEANSPSKKTVAQSKPNSQLSILRTTPKPTSSDTKSNSTLLPWEIKHKFTKRNYLS